jgi:hypothetical protein
VAKFRRLILLVGLIGGLLSVMTTPAIADSSACTPSPNLCSGYGYFVSYGDHLWVEDRAADGHSAVAYYCRYDNRTCGLVWNPHGAWNQPVDKNMNLAERAQIMYRICLGEYGSNTVLWSTCSAERWDRA